MPGTVICHSTLNTQLYSLCPISISVMSFVPAKLNIIEYSSNSRSAACYTWQYIILNNKILKLKSSVLLYSHGYISQYTVYKLFVHEINEVIIRLMIVKMIYCQYHDLTRDIWSNRPLCLQEFPRALPYGTFSGKGVYLTVFPLSCPNTDTVGADRMGEGGGGRNILAIQILLTADCFHEQGPSLAENKALYSIACVILMIRRYGPLLRPSSCSCGGLWPMFLPLPLPERQVMVL